MVRTRHTHTSEVAPLLFLNWPLMFKKALEKKKIHCLVSYEVVDEAALMVQKCSFFPFVLKTILSNKNTLLLQHKTFSLHFSSDKKLMIFSKSRLFYVRTEGQPDYSRLWPGANLHNYINERLLLPQVDAFLSLKPGASDFSC